MTSTLFSDLHPPLTAEEALLEADRCLECDGPYAEAPCLAACPADVDVPAFVAAIADGDPARAARTIFESNLLGGTCARVCPTEILCQSDCVLKHEGREPIDIGRLQRFATEWAFERGLPLRDRAEPNGKRVAVVGAGPAGLAAAGELAARGFDVTVYDDRAEAGGLVRYGIAPYRQTNEPLPDETRALRELGVELRLGTRVAGFDDLDADAVVLAVGMGADADIAYPGDDLPGVWDSLPFIEALKTGSLPKVGARVAVVGGGNTAVDVAVEARRLGAEVVALLYRRTEKEMPAYAHEVELAREEGVELRFLTNPIAFEGNGRLTGVRCVEMRLGEPDASGRRRPEPVPGSDFVVPVDTAVKAIGQRPRDEFAELVASADDRGRTSDPRVFAAGDAVNGGATVVEAVRGAKVAAQSLVEALL